jgi:hypothetical protein
MHDPVFALLIVVLLAAAVIAGTELYDRRKNSLHQQIMKDGIKVRGVVRRVEKADWLWRTPFPWRIDVGFEYEGQSYGLEQHCRSKPMLREGDHVAVYVYRKDPWKSWFVA